MGQKANPVGLRVGLIREWDSVWWNEKKLGDWIVEDEKIRKIVSKRFRSAEIERIKIERTPGLLKLIILTGKPALLIGQRGSEIESLKKQILGMVADKKNLRLDIKIEEVKRVYTSAQIIATNIALQMERNMPYKRVMKKMINEATKNGIKGIKIKVAGRLGGADMARTEWYSEGRIPTQTLRADIDYATANAYTKYGVTGIKVWLFKGEVLGKKLLFEQKPEKTNEKPRRKRRGGQGQDKKDDLSIKKRRTRNTKKAEQ